MNKKNGLRCPYCGQKIGYLNALINIGQGEYTCDRCKKYSNIKYNSIIWLVLIIAALLSCLFGFLLFSASIKGVLLAIVPFVVFYLIIPFCYILVPVKFRQKRDSYEEISSRSQQPQQQISEDIKRYVPKNATDYDSPDDSTKYIPNIKSR